MDVPPLSAPHQLPPVILDCGSYRTFVGFAGDAAPRLTIPTLVGKPKMAGHFFPGMNMPTVFFGEAAVRRRGVLTMVRPVEHGIIERWEILEELWGHVIACLRVTPAHHGVVLTEPPGNPAAVRERAVRLLLERFGFKSVAVIPRPMAALFSTGTTTGIVVDVGETVTYISCIYEGYLLPHATFRDDIGGRDIAEYLNRLLSLAGISLTTNAEREILRLCLKKVGFVAPSAEWEPPANQDVTVSSSPGESRLDSPLATAPPLAVGVEEGVQGTVQYELPDGTFLPLTTEHFKCFEPLFNPCLLGRDVPSLPYLISAAVRACDNEIRRALLANCVVCGGVGEFPGFAERLMSEVRAEFDHYPFFPSVDTTAPPSCALASEKFPETASTLPAVRTRRSETLHLHQPLNAREAAWRGASILGFSAMTPELNTADDASLWWITQADMKKDGALAVERKYGVVPRSD